MGKKTKNLFGYKHIKKPRKKRPGRHSKSPNKSRTKKTRIGQGKPWAFLKNQKKD